jgi:hypothetical protein
MVHSLNFPLGRLDTGENRLDAADTGDTASSDDGPPSPEPLETILERWLVLSEASNSINRCMGLPDLYPFVISSPAAGKLRFVHELLGA